MLVASGGTGVGIQCWTGSPPGSVGVSTSTAQRGEVQGICEWGLLGTGQWGCRGRAYEQRLSFWGVFTCVRMVCNTQDRRREQHAC
jgi:hypothetical protein